MRACGAVLRSSDYYQAIFNAPRCPGNRSNYDRGRDYPGHQSAWWNHPLARIRRVEMVGGSFGVESAPGKGTTIQAQMPLDKTRAGGGGKPADGLR